MKTKLILLAVAGLFGGTVFADEPVTVPNAHGQGTMLFRSTEPTVALFVSGRALGEKSARSDTDLQLKSGDFGHGQQTVIYERVR